jgi:hypothetical protein
VSTKILTGLHVKWEWWQAMHDTDQAFLAATMPRLLFSGPSGRLYLSWIRWLPCTQRPWSKGALQIQRTWKNLENYYKHLGFTNKRMATTRNNLHKIWGIFCVPFSMSENLRVWKLQSAFLFPFFLLPDSRNFVKERN